MKESKVELDCGGPCEHTDEEHTAFDRGVEDGEKGVGGLDSPYRHDDNPVLRESWLCGHSVGAMNRKSRIYSNPKCEVCGRKRYTIEDDGHSICTQCLVARNSK